METLCQLCGKLGHSTSQCPLEKQCFICGSEKCDCITGYPPKFDRTRLKNNYVQECFICGENHCYFDCPINEPQKSEKVLPKVAFENGIYKFGLQYSETAEASIDTFCLVCGSCTHDSKHCPMPNFKLSFEQRLYK